VENFGAQSVCGISFETTDDPQLLFKVAEVYPVGLTNRPFEDPLLMKETMTFGFLLPAQKSSVGEVPADLALSSGWRECNVTAHPKYTVIPDETVFTAQKDVDTAAASPTDTPKVITYPKDNLGGATIGDKVTRGTPAPTVDIDGVLNNENNVAPVADDPKKRTISPAAPAIHTSFSFLTTMVVVLVAALHLRR